MSELACPSCGKSAGPSAAGQSHPSRCESCGGLLLPKVAAPAGRPDSFGKYTLDREIGRGSMGIVYDARDTTLNRRVALKIMNSHKTEDPKEAVAEWQRFLQEARLTANLDKHPNIVTVYEAEVREGRRFIAMEFITGDPMNRWRLGENISIRDQVRLLRDVALAVHHAHEHGIIHRDLKPGNVLVTHGNKPVVTDFGLAKMERRTGEVSLTPSGYIVGSPGYMSPEQARGNKHIDRTTDVYSLGVMLYEIVAGRPPFEGRTPVDILGKVVEGVRTPPSAISPEAVKDEVLDRVCLKAMALRPQDRHSTALALASQLSEWLGEGKEALRVSPLRIAVTVTATVLVCAGVFLAWQHRTNSAAIRHHLERAEQQLKEENFGAAMSSYELALAVEPGNEDATRGRDTAKTALEIQQRLIREAQETIKSSRAPPAPMIVRLNSFKQVGDALYNQVTPASIEFKTQTIFEAAVTVPETGEYEIIVAASCDPAKGENAHFRIHLDGKPGPEIPLVGAEPADYKVKLTLPFGERRLGIEFTNDFWDEKTGEDRNLRVHGVAIRRIK
jgi:predicted Ser/Thr protein kinase